MVSGHDSRDAALDSPTTRSEHRAADHLVSHQVADAVTLDRPCRQAVLDAAESLGHLARWEWTPDESTLVWSENMFRLFGLEPGEITPTLEYVVDNTHPCDRARVEQAIANLGSTDAIAPVDFRFVAPDGTVSNLRAIPAVDEWRDGRPHRMIGWVRDLTSERSANLELAAHLAVTEALAVSSAVTDGGARVLAALAEALDCRAAVLWLRRGQLLAAELIWCADGVDLGDFRAVTHRALLRAGSDLPGLAWKERRPAVPPASARLGRGRRARAAGDAGLHGRTAFPAISAGDVLAIIELVSAEQGPLTDHLARTLTAIGYEIGHFVARAPPPAARPALTPRQIEVLELAGSGLSARASAARLGLAQATVLAHLANINERLRVTDKRSAVAEARRLGLLR